jgi:hypothetical protein
VSRIRLIMLAALAMFAFGSIAASSAFAEGPYWLVKGERFDCEKVAVNGGQFNTLLECLGGSVGSGTLEWLLKVLTGTSGKLEADQGALALASNLGNFTLKAGSLITIECATLHSPTTLVGGVPGRDHAQIHFSECTVSGHPKCDANSPDEPIGSGKINTAAKTELVLSEKKLGSKLLDLFEPESGTTFVTLEVTALESGACPTFTAGETKITGSVAAEVEPENTDSKEGMLKFPASPIATAWRWTGSGATDKWEEVKVSLKAFGIVKSEQIGLADVKLLSGEEFGAHNG